MSIGLLLWPRISALNQYHVQTNGQKMAGTHPDCLQGGALQLIDMRCKPEQ